MRDCSNSTHSQVDAHTTLPQVIEPTSRDNLTAFTFIRRDSILMSLFGVWRQNQHSAFIVTSRSVMTAAMESSTLPHRKSVSAAFATIGALSLFVLPANPVLSSMPRDPYTRQPASSFCTKRDSAVAESRRSTRRPRRQHITHAVCSPQQHPDPRKVPTICMIRWTMPQVSLLSAQSERLRDNLLVLVKRMHICTTCRLE